MSDLFFLIFWVGFVLLVLYIAILIGRTSTILREKGFSDLLKKRR